MTKKCKTCKHGDNQFRTLNVKTECLNNDYHCWEPLEQEKTCTTCKHVVGIRCRIEKSNECGDGDYEFWEPIQEKNCENCGNMDETCSMCPGCKGFSNWVAKEIPLAMPACITPTFKRPAATPEPMSSGNGKVVITEVIRDLLARDEVGQKKYKTSLKTDNGRDALMDAFQESCDMCMYLKQAIMERDNK